MRLGTIAASLVALAVTARGDAVIPLLPEQEAALTAIGRLPNQQHLSNLFGADAAEDLGLALEVAAEGDGVDRAGVVGLALTVDELHGPDVRVDQIMDRGVHVDNS